MEENRIVLVRGKNSEWFEQAIFVLKNPSCAKSKNLVFEAERIINDYMLSGGAAVLSPRLEKYKQSVYERAAVKRVEPKAEEAVRSNSYSCDKPSVIRTVVRKVDGVSIIMSAGLVVASFILGYIAHRIRAC